MKRAITLAGLTALFLGGYLIISSKNKEDEVKTDKTLDKQDEQSQHNQDQPKLILTTVYDNNQFDPNLKTGWGFSCLAKLENKDILFDTGADSPTLLSNMEKLGIKPEGIDIVVLSHIHSDHVGGLWGLLERNGEVKVYIPASFPDSFREKVKSYGAAYQDVKGATQIEGGIYSTGELSASFGIEEQALVIKTEKGLVVLTGCAHPGVVNMVRKAKEMFDEEIYLVMGGFHLGGAGDSRLLDTIGDFQELGVQKAAPCHCSGDRCRELFQQEYRENYIENGVGKVIEI